MGVRVELSSSSGKMSYEGLRSLGGGVAASSGCCCSPLLSLCGNLFICLTSVPQAVKGQVEEYLLVFREKGGKYLETYRTPTLTWEEVKAMKGAGTVGLGTGYATDHSHSAHGISNIPSNIR
eukprot:3284402-Pyramimonas_sp.AAC.1